jgi:hypothetical protein
VIGVEVGKEITVIAAVASRIGAALDRVSHSNARVVADKANPKPTAPKSIQGSNIQRSTFRGSTLESFLFNE